MKEDSRMISNTLEYSGENILERGGLFQSHEGKNRTKKRDAVDKAQTVD